MHRNVIKLPALRLRHTSGSTVIVLPDAFSLLRSRFSTSKSDEGSLRLFFPCLFLPIYDIL